VLLDTILAYER